MQENVEYIIKSKYQTYICFGVGKIVSIRVITNAILPGPLSIYYISHKTVSHMI